MKNVNAKQQLNIFEVLKTVEDKRVSGGKRHNLAVILLINIMAIMSGYFGVIAKGDFVDKNRDKLLKIFDKSLLKHGLPSKNTIDRAMQKVDFTQLNDTIAPFFTVVPGSSVHIDGKAIRGTVKDGQLAKQTFTSIVTAYSKGKCIKSKSFVNGDKGGEIATAQELIESLGLTGTVLTLDSLHCQKKP